LAQGAQANGQQDKPKQDYATVNQFVRVIGDAKKAAQDRFCQMRKAQNHSTVYNQANGLADGASHIHFSGGKGRLAR
jgi:hypothetical protein